MRRSSKTEKRKLLLKRETLRPLTPDALAGIKGGNYTRRCEGDSLQDPFTALCGGK